MQKSNQSLGSKASKKKFEKSPKGKARKKKFEQSPKGKARKRKDNKKYRQKLNENKFKLLGDTCFFHETNDCRGGLEAHEKSGNGHEKGAVRILRDEPWRASEFVHLCYVHHSRVSNAMTFGFTWEEIVKKYGEKF